MPVHFENDGISPGLKRGGVLNVVRHAVEVYCDPEHIPEQFTADLADLDFNDNVRWHDLKGTENTPSGDRPRLRGRHRGAADQADRGVAETATAAAAPAAAAGPRRSAGAAAPAPAARGTPSGADRGAAMLLWVGLGNPEPGMARNRHNIGFMALDTIAIRHGFSPWRRRFKGLMAEGSVAGEKILALKPQTYMNDSGESVQEAAAFYKLPPEAITAFHDELDLVPGKVRVKRGGGAAGHNGLRSMDRHAGHAGLLARAAGHRPSRAEGARARPRAGRLRARTIATG